MDGRAGASRACQGCCGAGAYRGAKMGAESLGGQTLNMGVGPSFWVMSPTPLGIVLKLSQRFHGLGCWGDSFVDPSFGQL